MNKKQTTIVLTLASLLISGLLIAGCVTSKVQTPGPNGTTITTTVVNTNNLNLDAAVLQGATAISVSLLVQKDPSTIQPLKNAHVALDGILNGANQMTTQEVLTMLKASGNPQLSAEVTSLVQTASSLEQTLLAKYGAEVGGQIAVAVTRAVDAGLIIGLAGH